MRRVTVVMIFLVAVLALPAVLAQTEATGELEFRANGEDFVREGFVSKDNWTINFDHVYVSVSNVRAYQTEPPYDPFAGELTRSQNMVGLPGQYVVDLAEGDENADTILLGTVGDAAEGYYNAVGWIMSPAESGEYEGQTVVMEGTAEKDGESITFTIMTDKTMQYTCGAFIGDERKGILQADSGGEVELTFHFDHIFGDIDLETDDPLNVTAPGFDPFAALAVNGVVEADTERMVSDMDADAFQMFVDILPSLGHTGE